MKTSLFTLLLGLLALTATGCNRSNAQGAAATDASELPWGETDIVAVAFVGYGASLGGISALLSMLNSCASGASVVNIDNGFGAGYQASLINHVGR